MSTTPIPNNLGATLLLVLALVLLPLGLGLPLLFVALARVRTWQGTPAFPRLQQALAQLLPPRTTSLSANTRPSTP